MLRVKQDSGSPIIIKGRPWGVTSTISPGELAASLVPSAFEGAGNLDHAPKSRADPDRFNCAIPSPPSPEFEAGSHTLPYPLHGLNFLGKGVGRWDFPLQQAEETLTCCVDALYYRTSLAIGRQNPSAVKHEAN